MKTMMTRLAAAAALCLTSNAAQAAVTYTLSKPGSISYSWQTAGPIVQTANITNFGGQTCALSDGYVSLACTSLTIIPNYFDEESGISTDRLTVEATLNNYTMVRGLYVSAGSFSRNGEYLGYDGLKLTVAGVGSTAAVAAVPEPATWALMLSGFGLTAAAMRRRRKVAVRVAA